MSDEIEQQAKRAEAWAKKGPRGEGSLARTAPPSAAEVEAWAAENGFTIDILKGPTGRIEGIGFTDTAQEQAFRARFMKA